MSKFYSRIFCFRALKVLLPLCLLFPISSLQASEHNSIVQPDVTLLKRLSEAPGASGFEAPVANILQNAWRHTLISLHKDGMGNLLGTLPGNQTKPRVLLMAHMDEVALMVSEITKHGFIHFKQLGGWVKPAVVAERWIISTPTGPVLAYTGIDAPHLLPQTRQHQLTSRINLDNLYLDVGAKNDKDAAKHFNIRPGLPATPVSKFRVLGEGQRYLGKAFDDRVGLAVITQSLKQLKQKQHPNTVEVAATVQEEVGLRGATVIYKSLKPNVVINLEAAIATDTPMLSAKTNADVELGKGPTIFIYDGSMIPNHKLVEWIVKIAKQNNIPIQYEALKGYGEDGADLQKSGEGVPTINIGIPVRYAHSNSGVIDKTDYLNTIKLIVKIAESLSHKQINQFRL